jgi:peptide/nickel transport system permease protein
VQVAALSPMQLFWRRFRKDKVALASMVFIAFLIIVAILAPLIVKAFGIPDPNKPNTNALDLFGQPAGPSSAHPMGVDEIGRDVFARVLYGARVSLAVGLLSAAVAGAIGATVGGVAGYVGGGVDSVLMRLTDAVLSVPRLPLLMIAAVVLQPSVPMLIVLIGAAGWMETARVVRADVRTLRGSAFVESAHAAGAGHARVLAQHLLPNAAQTIVVSLTLAVARGILLESALSFFGVGVQPPRASWGNMLYEAQATLATEPWLALAPGLFILITTLSVNLAGERLAARR